jgi:hypothetical protein
MKALSSIAEDTTDYLLHHSLLRVVELLVHPSGPPGEDLVVQILVHVGLQ